MLEGFWTIIDAFRVMQYTGRAGKCAAGVIYNIGALIIANTILEAPYYKYSILGPETLFSLSRPLYGCHLFWGFSV